MIAPTIAEVKKLAGSSVSGARSVFIPINEEWAIKLCDSKGKRDLAYDRQKRAAEIDLGPNVGGTIDLSEPVWIESGYDMIRKPYQYGYITEIVELFAPQIICPYPSWDSEAFKEAEELMGEHEEEIEMLVDCLESDTGFYFSDAHAGNLGWKNGQLICIDFD